MCCTVYCDLKKIRTNAFSLCNYLKLNAIDRYFILQNKFSCQGVFNNIPFLCLLKIPVNDNEIKNEIYFVEQFIFHAAFLELYDL